MMLLIIFIFLAILAVAWFALSSSDDWPDDDHLEGPKGGMTI